MLGLKKLWAAVCRLADNIDDLADTAGEVNHGIRARAGLDAPPRDELALQGPEAANGEDAAEEPTGARKGRRGR